MKSSNCSRETDVIFIEFKKYCMFSIAILILTTNFDEKVSTLSSTFEKFGFCRADAVGDIVVEEFIVNTQLDLQISCQVEN